MDTGHHLHRHEREPDQAACQHGVRQRRRIRIESGGHDRLFACGFMNSQPDSPAGREDAEVVAQPHVHERGNVKDLRSRLADAGGADVVRKDRCYVAVAFAEGVSDCVYDGNQPVFIVIGEIGRERVEGWRRLKRI